MSIERRYPLLKHDHDAADITSGVFAPGLFGTGTADSTKFLRGDGTWNDTLTGPFKSTVTGSFNGSAIQISSGTPFIAFDENDNGANSRWWDFGVNAGLFRLRVGDDAGTMQNILAATRSGGALSNLSLGNATANNTFTFLGTGVSTFGGQVIIGNTAPAEKLRLYDVSGYIAWYNAAGSTRKLYLQAIDSDAIYMVTETLPSIHFYTSNSLRVTLNDGRISSYLSGNEQFRMDLSSFHTSHVRATGWYGTGSHTLGGAGTEIGFSGGIGYLISYNRNTSSYQPLAINGSTVEITNTVGSATLRSNLSNKQWLFLGTTNGTYIFNGANEDLYLRPGTNSGMVLLGAPNGTTDSVEIRGYGISPTLRVRTPNSSPWLIELYRDDYASGSKVFNHKYDGTTQGWAFEHQPYVPGISDFGGGAAQLKTPNTTGVSSEWHLYSNSSSTVALRMRGSGGSNGAWLYASGSDFGLLNASGTWALHYDNSAGAWRAQLGNKEFYANGYRDEADSQFYIYNTSGYSYGSWRIGGNRGSNGYNGVVLNLNTSGKQWTWMARHSDGLMGFYDQGTTGQWSWYDDGTNWSVYRTPIRMSQGAIPHYGSSSYLSGVITIQSGGSPSGGSDGDQYLIY